MSKFIEEFYYGNLAPQARSTKENKTVQKQMNNLCLKGKQRKNDKYHSYKGTVGKVADNLLKRDFSAEKPFEKITTDELNKYIDYYNNERISLKLKGMSPVQYRTHSQAI